MLNPEMANFSCEIPQQSLCTHNSSFIMLFTIFPGTDVRLTYLEFPDASLNPYFKIGITWLASNPLLRRLISAVYIFARRSAISHFSFQEFPCLFHLEPVTLKKNCKWASEQLLSSILFDSALQRHSLKKSNSDTDINPTFSAVKSKAMDSFSILL